MPMMYQYSVSINGGGNALAADFEKNNDGVPRARIRKGRGTLQWWFCRDSSEQNTGGKKIRACRFGQRRLQAFCMKRPGLCRQSIAE